MYLSFPFLGPPRDTCSRNRFVQTCAPALATRPFQLLHACRNRKTGFPCPRGRGKAKGGDQCPGRVRVSRSASWDLHTQRRCLNVCHALQIDKSHPIHPRKEDKVKKVCDRGNLLWTLNVGEQQCSTPHCVHRLRQWSRSQW